MDDLWNSCLQTLDKQGPNMINLTADAQILSEIDDYAISAFGQRMKIIEILLMLSQNEKFFDIEINKYLNVHKLNILYTLILVMDNKND